MTAPIPHKARHDRMLALAENMLTLHKQLASAKSEAQTTVLQRQIASTDADKASESAALVQEQPAKYSPRRTIKHSTK